MRTCNFGSVRASFDVLVGVFDRDFVFTGSQRQVRDGYSAIFVIVAADLGFAGTFNGQR